MANILIVDDEISIQKLLTIEISKKGHVCKSAGSISEAAEILGHAAFEVVFLDIYLPDGNGIDFLSTILEQRVPPVVIMITGSIHVNTVEKALMNGAWDYLKKPLALSNLNQLLDRALIVSERNQLQEFCENRVDTIIGSSKPIIKSVNNILQAAQSDVNVLITGPSGTGKELFAHELHKHSRRSAKPFVVVDCAVLPETLIESILFGHLKGSFTGAVSERVGLIQQAESGTLFLDEVGELPMEIQKKFLRVLQERVVRPLGAKLHSPVDFRLVCATNRNLEKMVQGAAFRTDLFHRINVFPIHLPPIHKRQGDLELLTVFFIELLCGQHHCKVRKCSKEFIQAIQIYNWPGNVRELKNVLEKIILTTSETVLYPDHLPRSIRAYIIKQGIDSACPERELHNTHGELSSRGGYSFEKNGSMPTIKTVRQDAMEHVEQRYLKALMHSTQGNIAEATSVSGLAKSQLYRLLRKYKISRTVH